MTTAAEPAPASGAAGGARTPAAEILMEAALLGLFMVSACAFGALLESGLSPVRHALPDPFVRRLLAGLAMGLTAIGLIYSPWGRRSGAHMNPAVTLTFMRLGRVRPRTALLYAVAQVAGATLAVAVMARLIGAPLTTAPVSYVQTLPGPAGPALAFAAEFAISLVLMLVVLESSGRRRLAPWTGVLAGLLVGAWITFESPISGTSMNPARTFGSAAVAGRLELLWLYATAPVLGMLLAAELHHHRERRRARVDSDPPACAKLVHRMNEPCVFCAARAAVARGRDARAPREPIPAARHSGS